MKLTGFADEASRDLDKQIAATKDIGWTAISARMVGDHNIHELPEAEFNDVADRLDAAGIVIPEFGSLIGNWGKKIDSDFDITLAEVDRAIPRMKRLGTQLIRVMSYAQNPWGEDQQEEERFRRLREIVSRFSDAGLTAIHENCMNWGGFSAEHSLRLVEEIPGLKLVFDTGNPVFQKDRSKAEPFPWQDPMEFWEKVREHVVHIHIKDCENPVSDDVEPAYTMPGEGTAKLREILADAKSRGYDGWIAIEPHVATVFHAADPTAVDWQQCYDSYVEYGKRFEKLLAEV
ncbi:sugar phosphate isomerase/epimerase family protein [Haloferula sp.]|uniref:sugar phosphate isomerase/epimerase family protein n=1 Tax=Haloferula sp. TaxID=2497595 RepID=UPI00329E39E5